MADLVQVMLASIFMKRPARDFSAFARVSNQSEISSKPSSRAVFAIPGYMSVHSVSLATAAFGDFTEVAGDFGVAFYDGDFGEVKGSADSTQIRL